MAKYSGVFVIKDTKGEFYDYSNHKWGEMVNATIFKYGEAIFRLDNLRKENDCFLSDIEVREV